MSQSKVSLVSNLQTKLKLKRSKQDARRECIGSVTPRTLLAVLTSEVSSPKVLLVIRSEVYAGQETRTHPKEHELIDVKVAVGVNHAHHVLERTIRPP